MLELQIPGRGRIQLEHLVLDVNGTLARDGRLLDRVAKLLTGLKDRLQLHLLTADTFGRQDSIDLVLGLEATRLTPGGEADQKADDVRGLGAARVAAVGQGANDAGMLREAAIGVCVLGEEGLAVEALTAADVLVPDIHTALNLFEYPARLVATLRR